MGVTHVMNIKNMMQLVTRHLQSHRSPPSPRFHSVGKTVGNRIFRYIRQWILHIKSVSRTFNVNNNKKHKHWRSFVHCSVMDTGILTAFIWMFVDFNLEFHFSIQFCNSFAFTEWAYHTLSLKESSTTGILMLYISQNITPVCLLLQSATGNLSVHITLMCQCLLFLLKGIRFETVHKWRPY